MDGYAAVDYPGRSPFMVPRPRGGYEALRQIVRTRLSDASTGRAKGWTRPARRIDQRRRPKSPPACPAQRRAGRPVAAPKSLPLEPSGSPITTGLKATPRPCFRLLPYPSTQRNPYDDTKYMFVARSPNPVLRPNVRARHPSHAGGTRYLHLQCRNSTQA